MTCEQMTTKELADYAMEQLDYALATGEITEATDIAMQEVLRRLWS